MNTHQDVDGCIDVTVHELAFSFDGGTTTQQASHRNQLFLFMTFCSNEHLKIWHKKHKNLQILADANVDDGDETNFFDTQVDFVCLVNLIKTPTSRMS